jgi:hypothetical protein
MQLREGDAGQRLGVHLRHRADGRGGGRGTAQREGRQNQRLVVRGIDLHRVQHGRVPDQRRIAVGDRDEDRVVLHIVLAEHDARHLHHVFGALLFEVTMPMKGLSECLSAEWMMWRCRFGTAISIGSQQIELEECSAGDM